MIDNGVNLTLMITVYRALWAGVGDSNEMCNAPDDLITKYKHIVMVGDFNLPVALMPVL